MIGKCFIKNLANTIMMSIVYPVPPESTFTYVYKNIKCFNTCALNNIFIYLIILFSDYIHVILVTSILLRYFFVLLHNVCYLGYILAVLLHDVYVYLFFFCVLQEN